MKLQRGKTYINGISKFTFLHSNIDYSLFMNQKTGEIVVACNVKSDDNGNISWDFGTYYGDSIDSLISALTSLKEKIAE